MIDAPMWLWSALHVANQDTLKANELAILVGRLAAWHLMPVATNLPAEMAAPAPGDSISSSQLRDVWMRLADHEGLGDQRHAFKDVVPFPYEKLSDAAITNANDLLCSVILLEEDHRSALLEKIIGALLNADGSKSSDVGFPMDVADFVVQLVSPSAGERVLCPGPMADAIAIATMKLSGHPVVVSSRVPVAACIYAAIARTGLTVIEADPFHSNVERSVLKLGATLGAIVPPFNLKIGSVGTLGWIQSKFGARTSEQLGVELALRYATRRSAVVVPNSFLFGSGPDKALREHLIREGALAAVIGFPAGLLGNTNLPFTVLFLTPGDRKKAVTFCKVDDRFLSGSGKLRAHNRRFIGAERVVRLLSKPEETVSRAVKAKEIEEQEFVLTPDRYLIRPTGFLVNSGHKLVPLGELVEIVKPQFLAPDEGPTGCKIQEAIPSDMPKYGYLQRVNRTRQVNEKTLKARTKQQLVDGDVLLSTKGTIGTVAIAKPDRASAVPLLPSQASVILRVKAGACISDPRYLVMYLRSPTVQQALAALATGATIKNISLNDLRALPVWVPEDIDQATLIGAFEEQLQTQKEIEALEKKLSNLSTTTWKAVGLSETG